MSDILSFGEDTFVNFAFYSGLMIGKTLLMGPLTSVARLTTKTFCNPEDVRFFAPKKEMNTSHPLVERIRRCHQNDIENVVPFTMIGLLYVAANPYPDYAIVLFRTFAAARTLHTVCYLLALPQPCRALCYTVGWGATAAMTFFVFARTTFFR